MAAEGMPFPWRWSGGTISTDLDVIWGLSVKISPKPGLFLKWGLLRMIGTPNIGPRSPNFSKLPITIIYKGAATTVVTIIFGVIAVFFTFIISIFGGENFLSIVIIPIAVLIIAIGIFFVFGRTVYKIDEHVVRARYTGLFNTETDFEEPVQAYRAIECDRHFDGDGNVLSYQMSLDHPDSTRRITLFETIDIWQLVKVGEQAANTLHLPLVYKRN